MSMGSVPGHSLACRRGRCSSIRSTMAGRLLRALPRCSSAWEPIGPPLTLRREEPALEAVAAGRDSAVAKLLPRLPEVLARRPSADFRCPGVATVLITLAVRWGGVLPADAVAVMSQGGWQPSACSLPAAHK